MNFSCQSVSAFFNVCLVNTQTHYKGHNIYDRNYYIIIRISYIILISHRLIIGLNILFGWFELSCNV